MCLHMAQARRRVRATISGLLHEHRVQAVCGEIRWDLTWPRRAMPNMEGAVAILTPSSAGGSFRPGSFVSQVERRTHFWSEDSAKGGGEPFAVGPPVLRPLAFGHVSRTVSCLSLRWTEKMSPPSRPPAAWSSFTVSLALLSDLRECTCIAPPSPPHNQVSRANFDFLHSPLHEAPHASGHVK